jgi:hypothetical protein
MKAERSATGWKIELEWPERIFLASSLEKVAEYYGTPVEEMIERMKRHAQGTLSKSRPESLDEAAEDLALAREAWRSERLKIAEEWLHELKKEDPSSDETEARTFELETEHLEVMMQILNDRRLALAAEHDIDEIKMETDLQTLPDNKLRRVLFEIQLLGVVVHALLTMLEGGSDDSVS